jgi:transposase
MDSNNTMVAYSLDLRQRIVDAVEKGDRPKREIAEIFGIHESFIYKLLRQKRERGEIAPLPHGGGAEAILKEEHLMLLADLVAASSDATLEELRERMKQQGRVEASIATIWRGLEALGLSRKKRPGATIKPIRSSGRRSRKSK